MQLMLYIHVSFLKQVTYVLEGVTAHEDFCGHSGRLEAGDLQVMLNFFGTFVIIVQA